MSFSIDQYMKDLEHLVNIDSVSSEPDGARRIAAFFQERYEALGWNVKAHEFNPSIGPCLEISNRPLGEDASFDVLLLAHMDTVFPVGTAAERPFSTQGDRALPRCNRLQSRTFKRSLCFDRASGKKCTQ